MGRIERGGGDDGEPVRSPLGWLSYRQSHVGLWPHMKDRTCQSSASAGRKIALQPLSDRLALIPQPVALARAALLFQPGVERRPCRKQQDRHHEVASGSRFRRAR